MMIKWAMIIQHSLAGEWRDAYAPLYSSNTAADYHDDFARCYLISFLWFLSSLAVRYAYCRIYVYVNGNQAHFFFSRSGECGSMGE